MQLEYYPIERLKKEILSVMGKYLDLKKHRVFFFGSRVTGKNTDRSDIDIGIEGSKPISAVVLANVEEEIEHLPTLYKIEIVDFSHLSPKFRKIARQKVEFIN